MTGDDLLAIYEKRYASEPFIRLYNAGHVPDLRAVQRTNFCDIGVTVDTATGRAVVVERDRQFGKGRRGPGRAEYEPDAWVGRNRRLAVKALIKLGGTL